MTLQREQTGKMDGRHYRTRERFSATATPPVSVSGSSSTANSPPGAAGSVRSSIIHRYRDQKPSQSLQALIAKLRAWLFEDYEDAPPRRVHISTGAAIASLLNDLAVLVGLAAIAASCGGHIGIEPLRIPLRAVAVIDRACGAG